MMKTFTPLILEPETILINYSWSMPSKWTFEILIIKDFLMKYFDHRKKWIDPFAGKYSPAQITNDLNPERTATYHLDALAFLQIFKDDSVDGVIFDPPYSPP